jgi:secreted trypsin-like serine protease
LAASALVAMPSFGIIDNSSTPGDGVTSAFDGVGLLEPNNTQVYSPASGTLIDSLHVLTAAHAVYDDSTHSAISPSIMTFELGSSDYQVSSIAIDPNFTGTTDEYDIAVLTLSAPATGHTTYAYNTPGLIPNEVGQQTTLVGYGEGGVGTTGTNASQFPIGTKRSAINEIDQSTDSNPNVPTAGTLPAGLLAFDFDNSTAGTNGPLGGPGLGVNEGDTTDGDSGGPMFEFDAALGQYVIVGVTTDGVDPESRFGDVGWGTRVSDYDAFIGSVVPEPVTLAPIALGAVIVMGRKKKLAQGRRRGEKKPLTP